MYLYIISSDITVVKGSNFYKIIKKKLAPRRLQSLPQKTNQICKASKPIQKFGSSSHVIGRESRKASGEVIAFRIRVTMFIFFPIYESFKAYKQIIKKEMVDIKSDSHNLIDHNSLLDVADRRSQLKYISQAISREGIQTKMSE